MQSNDIKKILALVKEKNPSGFDLLYQHYFRFLFSVAYSVLNSEKDSYDVIQSVMMRLAQLAQDRCKKRGIDVSQKGEIHRAFRRNGRLSSTGSEN